MLERWRGRARQLLAGLCLLGAVSANALAPIELPASFERIDARESLEVLVDESALLTLADVQGVAVRFSATRRTRFAAQTAALWTRLALHNATASQRSVLLMNPSPYVYQVDMHLVRQGGDVESWALGSQRPREQRTLAHRYDVQPISLAAGEQVLVYIRHQSDRAMEINTHLYAPNAFLRFVQRDATSWGVFTGLVVSLVLYNLVAGLALRQRVFLFYVLHASVLFGFTLTMHGSDILVWFKPLFNTLMPELLDFFGSLSVAAENRISHILLLLVTITASLFGNAFFDLVHRAPRVTRLLKSWIALALLFVAGQIASAYLPVLAGIGGTSAYLALFFLLCWLSVAFFAALRRFPGWGYYLAGTGSFILLSLMQDAEWFGLELGLPDWISVYGTPVGLTLELVILSLGLGQHIRRISAERDAGERLLIAQSKFISVGQMLSGVVHQLKRPVIYAGTQLMKLESLMDRPLAEREAALPKALADMRRTIDFMDKTIVDIYRFYADEKSQQDFRPAEQIEHVISMLTPMTIGSALRIERTLLPELTLHGYANAFAHAMMIVLENATQVLRERAVALPVITVTMSLAGDALMVTITDNGGGIRPDRLDRIFELYARTPSQAGLGIGLALARRMIVDRLQGSISARNIAGGAEFTVLLPLVRQQNGD
ncbi:MAG: sensor histidine kinase [Rhodoferax sp.]